ncbi:MAG: hypothetical protein MSG64_08445 [Pyrinomonadaceae bacterium MAG19_C2-C3]|nr:hypothetical protein [Pyrinomonadaceae bacterium MAG19_C2-C3]
MTSHRLTGFKLFVLLAVVLAVVGFVVIESRSSAESNSPRNESSASSVASAHGTSQTATPAQNAQTAATPQATATPQTTAAARRPEAPQVEGCISCHGKTEPMHPRYTTRGIEDTLTADGKDGQGMTCTQCHGGNKAIAPAIPGNINDETAKLEAHVRPTFPERWEVNGKKVTRNPENTLTLLQQESYEFVRFVNPGDQRVAERTCGACHSNEVETNASNMMLHGGMLWGAALYNNGGYPLKDTHFGEAYAPETGAPSRLIRFPRPTAEQTKFKGILSYLDPLPRWEISQPGNVLRVFERGGRRRLEVGLPDREEEPGKPDKGLSPRGLGTNNRTDPVYLGLQKTRLLDPTLNMLGSNDHPGDFRSSGCTSCHTIYANDRSYVHSGSYAEFGNTGATATRDESLKDERESKEEGHPIKHQFTNRIPSSQCMTCHMHPGTNMVTTYYGMTWWDNETHADKMYPAEQKDPSEDDYDRIYRQNPEGAAARGKWSEREFLDKTGTPEFNKQLDRTQFADFHGHGWIYRAVFKKDRSGNMLDAQDNIVENVTPDKLAKSVAFLDKAAAKTTEQEAGTPVHLKDIHLEKGMHCADCHFRQDTHGNGNLYNEPRAAIEIQCIDCHGSIQKRATLVTSGFAAGDRVIGGKETNSETGRNLATTSQLKTKTATGRDLAVFQRATAERPVTKRDENNQEIVFKNGEIIQNSMVEPGKWWRVVQTVDTITPGTSDYDEQSRYAKTIRTDGETWGDVPTDEKELAHRDSNMTCFSCHSAWVTSCFGCHLSMKANKKMPNRHNEGEDSRNFTTYNYQVLRDDIFMLGRDGTVTGNRIAPVRSSSAILVSSQNQNREWIYSQQQTISAEGYSGQAFNTHVPHTVRGSETRTCNDCHVSDRNDNNAWLAQLFLQGTNFVNFIGQYAYVAAEDALEVVRVTEADEPQAVIGSTLHKAAYPRNYAKFEKGERELKTFFEHRGNPEVLGVQVRGEYAYVAAGKGGLRVYDVAQIDHKGFSERITTAPISPLGQRFYVDTKYCTAVAAPTTLGVDPARVQNPINEERPIHPLYAYLYVVDREEGLILVNAATLLDGVPTNNFLKRAITFNPDNKISGANNITIAGTYAYITTDHGLEIVDINKPLEPRIVGSIGAPNLNKPTSIAVQFRYAFITDEEGLKVIDVTKPEAARAIEAARVPLGDAHDVYVARTYAYVANGKEGIAIVNIEQPEQPKLDQTYNAEGKINDTHQVKVAMTNASLYAYVADGHNGLRVLQLTDPATMETFAGFSPRPQPRLIASFHTKGPALAVSKGLDRDRAVDESGNQVAVFGRRGAGPLSLTDMQRMYVRDGSVFTVSEKPRNAPREMNAAPTETAPKAASSDKSKDDANDTKVSVSKVPMLKLTTTMTTTAAGTLTGFGLLAFAVRRRRRTSKRE